MDAGTPCDAACAHVQTCLGITCAQLGVNCATMMGTQWDCVAMCVTNTPCSQLNAQTEQACQAQCSADGGTMDAGTMDAGMDAGMAGAACTNCIVQSCIAPVGACFQDPSCSPWVQCVQACNAASPPQESCFQSCDATYVMGKGLYDPVYTCACTSCSAPCTWNPCAAGTPNGP
jgi:hypothetical protein